MEIDQNTPINRAQALYNEPLNREKTREIEALLERADAERKAFDAIVALCDYLNRWNGARKRDLPAAEREIAVALVINPNLALAYYAQGFVERTKGDHVRALASFQKAAELDPTNARALAQVGAEELYNGRPREALAAVRKALALSPDSPAHGMFLWIESRTLFFDGNYKDAIPLLRQSIEEWGDLYYTQAYLVSALALTGDVAEAKLKLEEFLEHFPDLNTLERIIEAEQTNPNKNPFVVAGRAKFHEGLLIAGLKPY